MLAILGAGMAPGDAPALVKWTVTSGHCVGVTGTGATCTSEFADTRTFDTSFNDEGGAPPNVTASGWGNTLNSNTTLERGDIAQYGSNGLGVRNADGPRGQDAGEGIQPEHAMDNDERFDLILFDFGGESISLSEVTVGWYQNDADISVLAYTGAGDPLDDQGADYLWDRTYTSTTEDLTSHGWSIIGSYDVDFTDGTLPSTQPIDTAVSSSYWIVSAYNPVIGNCLAGTCNHLDYLDYVKIKEIAGTITDEPEEPPSNVPEPGTLLLFAAVLPLLRRTRNAAA